MIALGQISLQHRTSVYDARKKIRDRPRRPGEASGKNSSITDWLKVSYPPERRNWRKLNSAAARKDCRSPRATPARDRSTFTQLEERLRREKGLKLAEAPWVPVEFSEASRGTPPGSGGPETGRKSSGGWPAMVSMPSSEPASRIMHRV